MARRCGIVQPASPNDALIASWNFLDGSIAPNFGGAYPTFTRAGATATRVNRLGLREVVAADTPRFDYDPVTLAIKGLLIEPPRTNKVRQSAALATAPWSATNVVVTNAYLSLRGLSFSRLTAANTGPVSQPVGTFPLGNGTKSFAFYCKQDGAASGDHQVLLYDSTAVVTRGQVTVTVASNGVITAVAQGANTTVLSVQPIGDGIYRVLASVANVVGANSHAFYAADTGLATLTAILLSEVQVEDDPFPTSSIPTTTVAVTRDADNAEALLSAISGFSATEGSMFAEFIAVDLGLAGIADINDGGSNNQIRMICQGGALNMLVRIAGSVDVNHFTGTIAANVVTRSAIAWKVNDFASTLSGGAAATDSAGAVPASVTKLQFGKGDGVFYLNGHLRKLHLFNRRLTNAELQALTA